MKFLKHYGKEKEFLRIWNSATRDFCFVLGPEVQSVVSHKLDCCKKEYREESSFTLNIPVLISIVDLLWDKKY